MEIFKILFEGPATAPAIFLNRILPIGQMLGFEPGALLSVPRNENLEFSRHIYLYN